MPFSATTGQGSSSFDWRASKMDSNRQEKSVAESEAKFRLLLDGVKDYDIFLLDPSGIVTAWDSGPRQKANEVIGQHISCSYPAEDVASGKHERDLAEALAKGRIEHEGWRLRNGGSRFWAELVTTALKDEAGSLRGFSIVQRDVTERKRSETALRSVVDHSIDALITVDQHGVIQSFAGAAQKIFGYTATEVVGQKINMLMPEPWCSEHDKYMDNYLRTGHAKIIGIGREVSGQRKDGSLIPLDLTVTEFALDGSRFFTGILRDITERKAAQELLRVQATRDFLTGLWNRAATLDFLEKELSRSRREEKPVGLVFIDLDHFKQINDTYGHQAGDAVLRAASEKMRAIMRPYDLVGRYGGEEFLIVLPGCDEANLRKLCERLRGILADTSIDYEKKTISWTVSIGAAMANPAKETEAELLLRAADLALYRAKSGGRNRVELATV
jgi:diguanylate cyclase (GGDEF)-like protein/PAS domain S-box-containing protein